MESIKKCLWLSQITLSGFLLICSLIIPSVTERNGGVSNFGDHLSTIVPYVLSFALCVLFLCRTGVLVASEGSCYRKLAYLLYLLAFMEFLVLVSTFPRRLGTTYYQVHDYLGVVLYVYEFGLSVWLTKHHLPLRSIIFFSVQAGGSLVALLSILKVIHLLYYGQITGAIGFGLLLVTAFPDKVQAQSLAPSESCSEIRAQL